MSDATKWTLDGFVEHFGFVHDRMLDHSLLDEEIGQRAQKRTKRYRDRIQRLDTIKHPSVTKALAATFDRSGGWWAWDQKARSESDPLRCEMVYKQGIQHYPKSTRA